MIFIAHRVNTIKELQSIPRDVGVELDLRDNLSGNVYIQHNPFEEGEPFETYLEKYDKATMILNVKSERIEFEIIRLLQKYHITDYFFLDSSFPMIYLLSENNENNIALRYSEFEGLDTLRNMAGRAKWVWVDCFTMLPIDVETSKIIKKLGYKLCLVSPELQGRDGDIEDYADYLNQNDIVFDAICTKYYNIERWKRKLSI